MAKKKREEHTASWMDTYGDMVTLLLCFFVLLYAISAVDQTKWMNLVRSINPDAVAEVEATIATRDPDATPAAEDLIPKDFDTLYEQLKKKITERNLTDEIEVKKGPNFTFISFKDKIFFEGDSYLLTDIGKEILDDFAGVLAGFTDDIKVVEILGHTADIPERRSIQNDRFLASNRATAVLVYLQEKNVVDPSRMVSIGYGQFWPVADNDTPEGRAENRRVEVLITSKDSNDRDIGEFYHEIAEEASVEAENGVQVPIESAQSGEEPTGEDVTAGTDGATDGAEASESSPMPEKTEEPGG